MLVRRLVRPTQGGPGSVSAADVGAGNRVGRSRLAPPSPPAETARSGRTHIGSSTHQRSSAGPTQRDRGPGSCRMSSSSRLLSAEPLPSGLTWETPHCTMSFWHKLHHMSVYIIYGKIT